MTECIRDYFGPGFDTLSVINPLKVKTLLNTGLWVNLHQFRAP